MGPKVLEALVLVGDGLTSQTAAGLRLELRRHEDGILAYFHCHIDNRAVEAMNNNAKAISHRARGFRTERAFTLAMYHCLGGLQLPQTWH